MGCIKLPPLSIIVIKVFQENHDDVFPVFHRLQLFADDTCSHRTAQATLISKKYNIYICV